MSGRQPLDAARGRAAALVSLLDLLGEAVDAEVIQRAAFVPLSPEAAQAAFNLGCVVLMNMDALTAILSGSCSKERIAMFAKSLEHDSEGGGLDYCASFSSPRQPYAGRIV